MTLSAAEVNVGNLHIWKETVLNEVARAFTDPEMREIQQKTGIWEHGKDLTYPKKTDISVIRNGCLNFEVAVAGERVLFSIWMLPGEVRVGVKIPNCFITTSANKEVLSKIFDGQPCQRVSQIGKHTFFDWIWVNREFAAFDFMFKSIDDGMAASVLAERIVQILTHVHLAALGALIKLMNFKLVGGQIVQDGQEMWEGIIAGDLDAFAWCLKGMGGKLLEKNSRLDAQKRLNVSFLIPSDRRKTIEVSLGKTMQDGDGGECMLITAHQVVSQQALVA